MLKRVTTLFVGAAALLAAGCGFTATPIPATPVAVASPAPPAPPPPAPPTPPPSHHAWTWVGGAELGNPTGVYGVEGVAAAANVPGGRASAASWTDASGNFWLFGGIAAPSRTGDKPFNYFNDLWEYSQGHWSWMGGSNQSDQAGQYGVQGVPAPANTPGARSGTASWTDASGTFWLFGGVGLDRNGVNSPLNDVWEYKAGQWTWVSGSDVGAPHPLGVYGTRGIAAAGNVPGARSGAVAWTDPSGTLWLFGGNGYDSVGTLGYLNDLWAYSQGQWTWMAGSNLVNQPGSYGALGIASDTSGPGARYEAVGWADAKGALWLFGGAIGPEGQPNLANDLWRYSGGQWGWMGGSSQPNQGGTYGELGVAAFANTPGARAAPAVWIDASGTMWLFGGNGPDAKGKTDYLGDLWSYSAGQWTWVQGSKLGGQPGSYGTLGTPASSSAPGGRLAGSSWVDASGRLWLFGGLGDDATAYHSYLNDLWSYQP